MHLAWRGQLNDEVTKDTKTLNGFVFFVSSWLNYARGALVDGTGPGAARVAAHSTGGGGWGRRARGRCAAVRDGEYRQLLLELGAGAGGTTRRLPFPRQKLEVVAAGATRVLEQRHEVYSAASIG